MFQKTYNSSYPCLFLFLWSWEVTSGFRFMTFKFIAYKSYGKKILFLTLCVKPKLFGNLRILTEILMQGIINMFRTFTWSYYSLGSKKRNSY